MKRPLGWKLRSVVLTALVAFAAAVPLPAQEAAAHAPARKPPPLGFPILPGVWRLDGTDPSLPDADLQPLRTIVGKATTVGLGESIHTSGGYYEAKHRLFRFLVENLGFRAIAFETPWLDGDTANQYVQSCDGDPDTATAGFFGVWRSAELSALIGWMCEWNRTHPNPKDRLSVFAFDVQWQATEDAQALADFLRRVGTDPDAAPYAGLARCSVVEGTFRLSRQTPAENTALCNEAVQAVAGRFARDAKPLARQVGKADFEWAKLRLAGLQAWLEEMVYFNSDFPRAYAARDRGMATLFQGIRALRFPKTTKVAVWAHNGHVTRDPNAFGLTTMGSFLASSLRSKYVVLGLVSAEASIDWPGVGCGPVEEELPRAGSVEEILAGLGEPTLLVDLRFPGTSAPLLEPGRSYEVNSTPMVPRNAFDGLVFLAQSPEMHPLAWAPCR